MRPDGRPPNSARAIRFQRRFTSQAPGSVRVMCGHTDILCTASVAEEVPAWRRGSGEGWLTAEYAMLPGSTSTRKPRETHGRDGRSAEIQRLIGRSLRSIIDLRALGERSIWLDCDVLEADGGTRTAAICGAFVALVDALHAISKRAGWTRLPLSDSVAAVSVAWLGGALCVDPVYAEDVAADADFNVVMTGGGSLVEIQGTGEKRPFPARVLRQVERSAAAAISEITRAQRAVLGARWPL